MECFENMKKIFPGVKGRLIDLCNVSHKRYNLAVTVAMGKNMVYTYIYVYWQRTNNVLYNRDASDWDVNKTLSFFHFQDAIVVDNVETARACINYLKEQKAGRATLLPLQNIQVDIELFVYSVIWSFIVRTVSFVLANSKKNNKKKD